jgi:hypothetical protein
MKIVTIHADRNITGPDELYTFMRTYYPNTIWSIKISEVTKQWTIFKVTIEG